MGKKPVVCAAVFFLFFFFRYKFASLFFFFSFFSRLLARVFYTQRLRHHPVRSFFPTAAYLISSYFLLIRLHTRTVRKLLVCLREKEKSVAKRIVNAFQHGPLQPCYLISLYFIIISFFS